MRRWSKEEDDVIRKLYPIMGTKTKLHLTSRSIDSIEHRARRLGVKFIPTGEGPAGFLDIESSGLQGDFNYMYSWAIKTANKNEVYHSIISSDEMRNGVLDKRVVQELVDALQNYKRIYTYYGTRFDIPFARARALYHKIEFIPYGVIEHRDLYYLARRVLRIHRNRLESVADLLGIKGKTHLNPRIWVMANCGNEQALQYILKHNIKDVEVLEQVYKKLQPYEAKTRRYI